MADPVTIPDGQPTVEETGQDDVEMEGGADGMENGSTPPGTLDDAPRRVPFVEFVASSFMLSKRSDHSPGTSNRQWCKSL